MQHGARRPSVICTLALVVIAACGHSVSASAPMSASLPMAVPACVLVGIGPVDSSWQQVQAPGFTFCVPGSWRSNRATSDTLHPPTWKGKEGSVTWGLGRPVSLYPAGTIARATIPVVTTAPNMTPNPGGPTGKIENLCLEPTTTPVTIDSVVVMVTQISCHGTWRTTAWATTPAMYVQGDAGSAERARLLNAIVATIRFTSAKR